MFTTVFNESFVLFLATLCFTVKRTHRSSGRNKIEKHFDRQYACHLASFGSNDDANQALIAMLGLSHVRRVHKI